MRWSSGDKQNRESNKRGSVTEKWPSKSSSDTVMIFSYIFPLQKRSM